VQEIPCIEVFPNPTADFIALTTPLNEENFTIYNQLGQKMMLTYEKLGLKMILDVRHFPDGLYYLQLNDAQLKQSTTFVKCNGSL
jgi:hypothetical protein